MVAPSSAAAMVSRLLNLQNLWLICSNDEYKYGQVRQQLRYDEGKESSLYDDSYLEA